MKIKKIFIGLVWFIMAALSVSAQARPELKPFVSGSYQQLLASNVNKPFMLVIWSINCSSCLKDMALLSEIQKKYPDIKMIMLAADELSDADQIEQILEQQHLDATENWVVADDNTQKLNYEIDPKWYGEIPRTYFFDSAHQRTGISGVMSKKDYEDMLHKILK